MLHSIPNMVYVKWMDSRNLASAIVVDLPQDMPVIRIPQSIEVHFYLLWLHTSEFTRKDLNSFLSFVLHFFWISYSFLTLYMSNQSKLSSPLIGIDKSKTYFLFSEGLEK